MINIYTYNTYNYITIIIIHTYNYTYNTLIHITPFLILSWQELLWLSA